MNKMNNITGRSLIGIIIMGITTFFGSVASAQITMTVNTLNETISFSGFDIGPFTLAPSTNASINWSTNNFNNGGAPELDFSSAITTDPAPTATSSGNGSILRVNPSGATLFITQGGRPRGTVNSIIGLDTPVSYSTLSQNRKDFLASMTSFAPFFSPAGVDPIAVNVVVPEPSTYAFLGGLVALGATFYIRRRKTLAKVIPDTF